MPLLSYLLGNALDDLVHPAVSPLAAILDHHLDHDDVASHPRLLRAGGPIRSGHLHPWRHTPVLTNFMHPHHAHQRSIVRKDSKKKSNGFHVNLDVQQFKPEEIDVKVVDGFIVVEAKHEERLDEHGFISREFKRRYRLPEEFDMDAITSKLSSDGILSIEAPKKNIGTPTKERVIPITHTHAPAVTAQPPAQTPKDEGENDNGTEKMDQ